MVVSLEEFRRKRRRQTFWGVLLFWGGLVLLGLDMTTPFPTPTRGAFAALWLPVVAAGAVLYIAGKRLPLEETIRIARKRDYAGELHATDLTCELHCTLDTAERILEALQRKGYARLDTRGEGHVWVFPDLAPRPVRMEDPSVGRDRPTREASGTPADDAGSRVLDRCIVCEAPLEALEVDEDGRVREILRCSVCRQEHVLSPSGRLFLIDRLEYGCCLCCRAKRMLVASQNQIVCSMTGIEHAVFKRTGEVRRASDLEHGFCTCCSPHQPLELVDGRFLCHAKPDIEYVRVGDTNQCVRKTSNHDGPDDPRQRLLDGTLDLGGDGLPV